MSVRLWDTSPRTGLARWSAAIVVAVFTMAVVSALWTHRPRSSAANAAGRFISLSPAVTSTLVAIGARPQIVGVSDYCHFAVDVGSIQRVGSGYTPNLEAIVRLSPAILFVEAVNAPNVAQLAGVVKVESLPWLTLPEVIASTRAIGAVAGQRSKADVLASTYETSLRSHVDASSPRVLMAMAHVPGAFKEVVFIRKNSIHGRVLEAAGARNAIDEDITSAPRLSLEQLILRDPDGIVILQPADHIDPHILDDWRSLNVLRAVKTNQISVIAANDVAIPGPPLLTLLKRIVSVVGTWKKGP